MDVTQEIHHNIYLQVSYFGDFFLFLDVPIDFLDAGPEAVGEEPLQRPVEVLRHPPQRVALVAVRLQHTTITTQIPLQQYLPQYINK